MAGTSYRVLLIPLSEYFLQRFMTRWQSREILNTTWPIQSLLTMLTRGPEHWSARGRPSASMVLGGGSWRATTSGQDPPDAGMNNLRGTALGDLPASSRS